MASWVLMPGPDERAVSMAVLAVGLSSRSKGSWLENCLSLLNPFRGGGGLAALAAAGGAVATAGAGAFGG
eukprot:15407262-Alexandrium_andersonii.AAC.1